MKEHDVLWRLSRTSQLQRTNSFASRAVKCPLVPSLVSIVPHHNGKPSSRRREIVSDGRNHNPDAILGHANADAVCYIVHMCCTIQYRRAQLDYECSRCGPITKVLECQTLKAAYKLSSACSLKDFSHRHLLNLPARPHRQAQKATGRHFVDGIAEVSVRRE